MFFFLIGDEDTVLGYQFAGVKGAVAPDRATALPLFTEMTHSHLYKILLLTDEVADLLDSEVTEHRLSSSPPYIVVINSIWGEEKERKNLEQVIQEAVGIKIGK